MSSATIMARPDLAFLWLLLTVGIVSKSLDADTAEGTGSNDQVHNLTHRQLRTISPCEDNCTVTTLLLSGNQISLNESDRLALTSYVMLTQLYLDNNAVTDVKAKYFTVVPRLKVLSLSGNKISRLDPEVFYGLDDLTELDLSNNSLSVFPGPLLSTLKNLQVLNVEGNLWTCSCELLQNSTETLSLASNATCASPQRMLGLTLTAAKATCSPTPTTAKTSTVPTALPPTPHLNHSLETDVPVAQGNSWKFTVSVGALGLTTASLILCAIKGPSWYRVFHNYKHRRLHDHSAGGTTVFHQTPRHQQVYSFEGEGGRRGGARADEEEDEDGYFEDPYIRREE